MVIGGVSTEKIVGKWVSRTIATVEVLEEEGWRVRASMGTERWGMGVVGVEDKVYVFGGWNGGETLDSIERYRWDKDEWEEVEVRMPMGVAKMGVGMIEGGVII
jgi:N-acetylneuraminic acid mutarotase